MAEPSKGPLQGVLRNLQAAYVNFWTRRARYPSLKRKGKTTDSATYFRNCFTVRDGRITLAKQDRPLDVLWSRPLPESADPSQVMASRNSRGQYHVSILVEAAVHDGPSADVAVCIDVGVTALVTLSTGEKVTNPRHERADRTRLARKQRALSRKARGSNTRAKARLEVARAYGRVVDRRRDQWRQFRAMLAYQCRWYGRTLVVIDRWFPSSTLCSACGATCEHLPLDVREWTCTDCGVTHDRDVNAATNIQAAGLAVLACGDGARPPRC